LKGRELFSIASEKLAGLLAAKVAALGEQAVTFRAVFMSAIPIPGSVTAGCGEIRAGGKRLALDAVRGVKVRTLGSLTSTQEYTLTGDSGALRFRSIVENSPVLLRYLKSKVPDERWTTLPNAPLTNAKLMAVLLVIALIVVGMQGLAAEAGLIKTELALSRQSRETSARVLGTEADPRFHGRLSLIAYEFDLPDGSPGFGEAVIKGPTATLPRAGDTIKILYAPDRPSTNRPVDTSDYRPIKGTFMLFRLVVIAVCSVPYVLAVLLFKRHDDPFLEWIG